MTLGAEIQLQGRRVLVTERARAGRIIRPCARCAGGKSMQEITLDTWDQVMQYRYLAHF